MTDLAKADVLDHILRYPLPWRTDEALTECGKAPTAVKQVVTHTELRRRIKDWGQQRTAMTVCMTCAARAPYSRSWERDPVNVIERETSRVRHQATREHLNGEPGSERARFTDELRAIAALVDAHRDEFDAYLTGLDDTVNLAARRAAKRQAH